MQSPFLLMVVDHEHSTTLRERMDAAGCVFEFVVFSPAPGAPVDETLHRQALAGMGCFLAASRENRQAAQTGHYLPEVYDPQADSDWQVHKASATALSPAQRRNLTLSEDYANDLLALYAPFSNPPYGTRFKDGEAQSRATFQEWLDVLGLQDRDDVVVLDWVNGYTFNWIGTTESPLPEWEPWSEYFEDGLEWWGIWCLTVWNPERNTLSVLVASATD